MPDELAEAKAELARREKSELAEAKAELARREKQSAAPSRPPVSRTDRKPAASTTSPFALRGPTTIGPPHPDQKPNLLQQATQGLGHLLGLPSGLAASAAMQPIAGKSLTGALSGVHKPQTGAGASRLDKKRFAELQHMNIFQRASELSGQSFADPNLGRPYAQSLEQDVNKAQFGHAAGPMAMLGHVTTDPLTVMAVNHPIAAVAFTANAAAGAADAATRFTKTHDPDDAIEAAISLAMAHAAGSHAKGQIPAGRRLTALSEAIVKQGKPVPPERIARLAQRFQVDPAKLTKAVGKGTPELAKAAAKDPLVSEKPTIRKPTPKPKEDAAAKRERENVRTADKRVPVKPVQAAEKPAATSMPQQKPKAVVAEPPVKEPPKTKTAATPPKKPPTVKTTPAAPEPSAKESMDTGRYKLSSEKEVGRGQDKLTIAEYHDPATGKVVVVHYRLREGEMHDVNIASSDMKPNTVGAGTTRAIFRDLAERIGVTTINGVRVSGARPGHEIKAQMSAKEKPTDAVQVKSTAPSVPRKAGPKVGLREVGEGDAQKAVAGKKEGKAEVVVPVSTTDKPVAPAKFEATHTYHGEEVQQVGKPNPNGSLTLKYANAKRRMVAAYPRDLKAIDKPAAIKLTMAEANTLGVYHAEGDKLGDALSKARRGIAITPEQQAALQKLVKEKKLSRSQFPNLYGESPKDVALREKGPQELHANVNPFELLRKAKNSQGGQAVSDFIYGQKSALTHESKPSLEAVNKHENAHMTAHLQADETLPAVTSHLLPEDSAKFGAYGVADRLLAEKNRNRQIISAAPARRKALLRQVRTATAARDAAILTHDPQAIRKAERALHEAQATSTGHLKVLSEAKRALRENALERHGDPYSVILPNGVKHVIKEAEIGPFFSRPDIATALAAHKAGGEAILHSNQSRQGNLAGVSVGEHTKSYFPARALDDTGALRRASSSKGGRHQAAATMAKNMDASHFAGNAHSYDTDYHSYMRDAMSGSLTRATEREMHNTLLKEGQMVPFDKGSPDLRYTEGQLEINYKGKWEPAHDFSIQKGESRDPRLPERVVMPSRLYAEMQPLFDLQVQTLTDQMANSAMSGFMRTYLMAPADAMQHTAALSGRAAYGATRAVSPTDRPIVTGVKQAGRGLVAPLQSAVNFVRFWNPNLYDTGLRTRALKSMSEAGVLPSNFGDTGKAPDKAAPKNLLDSKNWTAERAKHFGHNILYGDRGVLSNAGTAVYKIFEDQGALKSEEGRSMLHQTMRETFNTYSKTDRAGLSKVASTFGGGSFYETGLKNRTTAFSAGKHVYAASLASRAILVIGAVRAATGKNPWDIPGYKWGYIPVWKDPKTGEVLMFDAKVFDRIGFYPDQMVHAVLQSEYDVQKKRIGRRAQSLEAGTEAANFAMAPVVSGPVPAIASNITGKLPYVYPDRTLSGIEVADNPSKKLGMTWKRGLSLAVTALPLTSALSIDPAHDMVASTPKSKDAEKINRVLRVMGLPQLRTGVDPKVVEKRRAAAERGAVRADAKALGKPVPKRSRGGSSLFGGGGSLFTPSR